MEVEQILSIVVACLSDPVKEKRLTELLDAANKLDEARAKLDAQEARNKSQVEQARGDLAKAEALQKELSEWDHSLDRKELELGRVIDGVNSEKDVFNKLRAQVDQDQASREASVS